jgi:hypothetical protein
MEASGTASFRHTCSILGQEWRIINLLQIAGFVDVLRLTRQRTPRRDDIMKVLYAIASAAFISWAAATPATAAPAMPSAAFQPTGTVDLVPVQYAPPRHGHRAPPRRVHRAPPPRHHYRAGHRYRSAPHGWHRYNARPRNWNSRGCITVGALWFCP